MFSLLFIISVALAAPTEPSKSPHIILIVADDLGFNDVSFRGSEDIHTPNIDALGYSGRIFDRHYTLPSCTSSRASLLTGLHAVRTGMQGPSIKVGEPRGLPLNFTILPQYLKKLNYSTHLIGKWHEGSHEWAYTPRRRGYDTFLGFYNEMIGYFSHEVAMSSSPTHPNKAPIGYDMHQDNEVAFKLRGRYATELFTSEAERIIWQHNSSKAIFLQVAHLAPHTGENKTQNEVASDAANDRQFGFIPDDHRRRYAGAVTALDNSVGRIIHALADRNMLTDSVVVFMSDNGAPTIGRYNNSGSNWPLRGQKESLHEGAVRTVAALWHKRLNPISQLNTDLFHITDWLPTIYEAAGGKVEDLGDIDGVSHWPRLSGQPSLLTPPLAPRTGILVNSRENEDAAYIQGWWKYIVGPSTLPQGYAKLLGDPGRTTGRQAYNLCGIANSGTTRRLFEASEKDGFDSFAERAAQIRRLATVPSTCRFTANTPVALNCTDGCLFNLRVDPCETKNVAVEHPEIVSSMLLKLRLWDAKSVPQSNRDVDVTSDPNKNGGAWVPWVDMHTTTTTSKPGHLNQTTPMPGGSQKTTGAGSLLVVSLSMALLYITSKERIICL